MNKWDALKQTDLGEELAIEDMKDLKRESRAIYGGVSWPAKRPGFAVVLAMHPEKRFDNYEVCLLDEFESFDMRELVRQCGVLDFKYRPKMWIGDNKNGAADIFIRQMNDERQRSDDRRKRRQFSVSRTPTLETEPLYGYILPELKDLLKEQRRQLFLRNSKILDYLSTIEQGEVAALEPGDYPAIEALAFAVLEMRSLDDDDDGFSMPDHYGQTYDPLWNRLKQYDPLGNYR
jgi:hypothetical protein